MGGQVDTQGSGLAPDAAALYLLLLLGKRGEGSVPRCLPLMALQHLAISS